MKNKKNKEVNHKGDVYQIPFSIMCTVSGLTKVYTSEDYINGKLDRFGGLAKLRETYICRDAKKLKKSGMSDADIRAKLNAVPVTAPEAPVADVTPEIKVSLAATSVTESDVNKPIAKKDKRGWWRNEKGHLIKKDELANYQLVEEPAA